jgi:hypothetical protein
MQCWPVIALFRDFSGRGTSLTVRFMHVEVLNGAR